jgi:hypothetical protein
VPVADFRVVLSRLPLSPGKIFSLNNSRVEMPDKAKTNLTSDSLGVVEGTVLAVRTTSNDLRHRNSLEI